MASHDPPFGTLTVEARFDKFLESYNERQLQLERRITALEQQVKNVWRLTALITTLASTSAITLIQIILRAIGLG